MRATVRPTMRMPTRPLKNKRATKYMKHITITDWKKCSPSMLPEFGPWYTTSEGLPFWEFIQ